LQIYVREKWLDEERNQEGHEEGGQKGPRQKEEVKRSRVSGISSKLGPRFARAFLFGTNVPLSEVRKNKKGIGR